MSNEKIIASTSDPIPDPHATRPRLGDRPKRGIKTINLKIVDKSKTYRPHHQKSLIIDLLEFKQGQATVEELVDLIEANPAYWARLNTVQSPYNCVVYHAKQLADVGFLSFDTVVSPTQSESRKAPQQNLEIVQYSKSKAKFVQEEKPTESVSEVEAELGIMTEVNHEEAA